MPGKLNTHSASNLFIPIDACYQYRSPSRLRIISLLCFFLGVESVGMASIQYLHLLPSSVNHKWGGDRGSKIPPCRTLHSWLLSPLFLGFFPLTLFRPRNSKHCCVIPPYLSRFPPSILRGSHPHSPHGHNGKQERIKGTEKVSPIHTLFHM